MIMGGTAAFDSSKKARKTYLSMVQNIQLTGFVPKIAWIDNPSLNFQKKLLDISTTRTTMHSLSVYE